MVFVVSLRVAIVVAAMGCNQIYGLDPTILEQDKPPVCPPLGTAPRFSTTVQIATTQNCVDYSPSTRTGTAMAVCYDAPPYVAPIMFGPQDNLAHAVGLADDARLGRPRLAPEGDEAFVMRELAPDDFAITLVRHDGARWTAAGDLPIRIGSQDSFGTPSVRGDRRVLVRTDALHELAEANTGTWAIARTTTLAELGVLSIHSPNLSEDGLRLVFAASLGGQEVVMYTDRDSIDAAFRPAVQLANIPPQRRTPYLTADCGRLYYSTTTVVYAELE